MPKDLANRQIFYGWFIVAASLVISIALGGFLGTFGVFFKPIETEFGWSRTVVSSGFTALCLGYAVSIVVTGRLADRYSPRPILILSAILSGIGLTLSGGIHNVTEFRLLLFLAGLGGGANWSVPMSTIQRWFHNRPRAGLALSIAIAGIGIGALVFAPLINSFILSYGWRKAYPVFGGIFFAAIAISAIFMRRNPTSPSSADESDAGLKPPVSREWTTREVIVTPAFLILTFVFCVGDLSYAVVSVHLVPHAIDVGISATVAAAALGLFGGFSVPGRLGAGPLSDRMSWEKVLVVSAFGMAASMFLLIFLKNNAMLYAFVLLEGVFSGLRVPVQVGLMAKYFGTHSLGTLIGITGAAMVFLEAVAPYAAGFTFDTTGSYFWAFMSLVVLLVSAGILAKVVKKPV
ncbi:MAG: MFS transporter [Chloroflexota bacterium]